MEEFKKYFSCFNEVVWQTNKVRFLFFVFITLISVFLATCTSILTKKIVDDGIISKNIKVIFIYGIITFLVWFFSIFLSFLGTIVLRFLRNRVENDLRVRIILNFFSLDYKWVSSKPSAYFLSRIFNEPDSLLSSLLQTTSNLFINLFWIFLGFAFAFYVAPQLTLFIIPFLFLNLFLNHKFGTKFKFLTKERHEKTADLQGYLNNLIENYLPIRIFNLTEKIIHKFAFILRKFLKFLTKLTIISAGVNNITALIQIVMQLGLLLLAGFEILNNRLTIGSYLGFSSIFWYLISSLETFYSAIITIKETAGEIERMEELTQGKYNFVSSTKMDNTKIVFKNVKLSLNNKKLIKFPNFEIEKNEKVLIVGENGVGKTSLLYTVTGLYSPSDGEVLLPDRNRISFSFASPLLLEGSVLDNLDILGVKREKIDNILKMFNINEIKFKNVNSLSSGERKKIDLIRCLLKDSDIYIFDEPFNHLDLESQKIFINILTNYLKNKTVIISSPVDIREDFKNFINKVIFLKKEEIYESAK